MTFKRPRFFDATSTKSSTDLQNLSCRQSRRTAATLIPRSTFDEEAWTEGSRWGVRNTTHVFFLSGSGNRRRIIGARMMNDRQLLARYISEASEEAFTELTRRHAAMVYSAALRQVRNEQLAKDVAQVVFTNLARRARSVPEGMVLAGWLHRDTRYTALDFIRAEARRLRREQQSIEMTAPNPDPQPSWEAIRPLLDEALTKLAPDDRDALLLRYFEQLDFAEVGVALGASTEAARKRADRALERLRQYLAKRGITSTAAALGGALTVHAVELVPAGLIVSVAANSVAAVAPVSGHWLSDFVLMTKSKIAIGIALMALMLATPLMIQQQALATARAEQSQLQARLRVLPASTAQATQPIPDTFDTKTRDRTDLERLRRETTALQTKIAEFSAHAQQLAATRPWHKPGGILLGEVLRMRDTLDVGQQTPTATIQTLLWATLHGDTNRMAQLFVFDTGADLNVVQQQFQNVIQQLVEGSSAPEIDDLEMHFLEEQPGQNSDLWVVSEEKRKDGSLYDSARTLLRPSGTGWSLVIGTNGDPVAEEITTQP
jgi:RNA polymerase sigma factor (sigma-70 family)